MTKIENYRYKYLDVDDFIMYQEPHRLSVGIVVSAGSERWNDDSICVRARDIKIIKWDDMKANPVLVESHLINNYTITYFGKITEDEFFEQHPEYNI